MAVGKREPAVAHRTEAVHELLSRPRAQGVYSVELVPQALLDSLKKFDPRVQIRNPVMFVVLLGALVTAALTVDPALFGPTNATISYNAVVTTILLLTVWFANIAEAIAEGRGKAKAATLRPFTATSWYMVWED